MLGASVFPFMTSLVYICLWKRQNIHGWTIAATTGSLFLMYLCQGTSLLISGTNVRENLAEVPGCGVTGMNEINSMVN